MANQMMERALQFAGYEVEHSWGEGGHSGAHGTAIFPDAMRWLWKGWPEPPKAGRSRNNTLNQILLPGERWQAADGAAPGPLAVARGGEVRLDRAGEKGRKAVARAFGPDSRLYSAGSDGRITIAETSGRAAQVADGIRAGHLVVSSSGNLYATEPARGRVWLVAPGGKKQVVDEGIDRPTGVTLSPDQTLLYVADAATHWVYSYQVQPDGTLRHKQQYYWLHIPDDRDESEAGGMCVDREGRLYVSTNLGVQVCDQPGRVNCILPVPGGAVSAVALGGPAGDTLHAVAGGKLYRRKLGAKGAYAWDTPNRPPVPGL
jgi:sugar lactone lactonase YvrE